MKKHKSKSELKPNKSNNLKFLVFWEKKNFFCVYHKTKMIYVQVTHRAEMNISTIRTMLQSVSWWRLLQRRKNAQIPKIYRCWLFWALASFSSYANVRRFKAISAVFGLFSRRFYFLFFCVIIFPRQKVVGSKIYAFPCLDSWKGRILLSFFRQAGGPAAHQEDNPD